MSRNEVQDELGRPLEGDGKRAFLSIVDVIAAEEHTIAL
jgi:hypothetical protein